MEITPTTLPDVRLIAPEVIGDARGFFMETWQRAQFAAHGIDCDFVQDNHSRSVQGTLRGLHYQIRQPQGKLVRVTAGEIFDVAVDLRKSSPTFGRWVGTYLSADNKRMLFIPPGFAHGFYVPRGPAEVQYKCSDYYAPAHERCIRWDDPELAIDWPLIGDPILSDRDRLRAQAFAGAECFP
jgi:dTDP-4-dehydrorhamnose 3,5-epimerase